MNCPIISVRNWLKISLIIGLLWWALPAKAADFSLENFSVDYQVNTDTSVDVKETITVDFSERRHGIFRTIPHTYTWPDGVGTFGMPITVKSVTNVAGKEWPYSMEQEGPYWNIRIGDAGKTVSGQQTYVISYHVDLAINFFPEHDEFYWNVTGDTWDTQPKKVSATVHLPNNAISPGQECFTGPNGSTEKNCQISFQDSLVTASAANTFLTVAVSLPKGTVMEPDPASYRQRRIEAALNGEPTPIDDGVHVVLPGWMLWSVNLGLPLLTLFFLLWWWATHGRDPRGSNTLVVQYDPPDKLRPAEMGVIKDEKVDVRDITATIIDLAVRGYLKIIEEEKHGFLGIGSGKKYTLQKMKEYGHDAGIAEFERLVLDGLFLDDDVARSSVSLDDLKKDFPKVVGEVKKELYESLTANGYFVSNPNSTRVLYFIIGAVLMGIDQFFTPFHIFGLLIAGILVALFSWTLPKRTAKGVAAKAHIRGFEEYLSKAEKYRLQWQEKEHIFEQFLPYAMVLGVAEKWSKVFADVMQEQPSWYQGTPGSTFNSLAMYSALNSFSTATTHTAVAPSSGGSGFGGGGFSGGGGGGGGGGSW